MSVNKLIETVKDLDVDENAVCVQFSDTPEESFIDIPTLKILVARYQRYEVALRTIADKRSLDRNWERWAADALAEGE